MTSSKINITWRTGAFLCCSVLIAALVWIIQRTASLHILAAYSSQVLLIPLLCGYLLWNERERIFIVPESAPKIGALFAAVAVISGLCAYYFRTTGNAYLFAALSLFSAIQMVIASFVTVYGRDALRGAVFPFCMLVLAIPLPNSFVEKVVSILQAESAWLCAVLFSLVGIPVYKEGFVLTVPGASIEVARECSGINSSIALFLTVILIARQSLKSRWRRALLVAGTIPLSILKNSIRITTLTILAVRIDPSFLTGRLHREGGFVFYLLAIALIIPFLKLLKRGDAESANLSVSMEHPDATGAELEAGT